MEKQLKVNELMERVGMVETGRALAYIKDALAEMNILSETHITTERIDITEDQRFYNIPNENTRNWELQFLGQHNTEQLKTHLLDNYNYEDIISKRIYSDYYDKFKINPVKYAHAVSMLLTLSTFAKRNYDE